jgi:hypothetical protein
MVLNIEWQEWKNGCLDPRKTWLKQKSVPSSEELALWTRR